VREEAATVSQFGETGSLLGHIARHNEDATSFAFQCGQDDDYRPVECIFIAVTDEISASSPGARLDEYLFRRKEDHRGLAEDS
jgi:hypothetical protein